MATTHILKARSKYYLVTAFISIILSCCPKTCLAQTAEIHLTPLSNMSDSNIPANMFHTSLSTYSLTLSSGDFKKEFSYSLSKNTGSVHKNIPVGKIKLEINDISYPGTNNKPFSDSIEVHPGVNAIFIDIDVSGELVLRGRDSTEAAAMSKDFGYKITPQPERRIPMAKPAPPVFRNDNGTRRLLTPLVNREFGISDNPALDALTRFPGVSIKRATPTAVGEIIMTDPRVKWSWKGGAYIFWMEN